MKKRINIKGLKIIISANNIKILNAHLINNRKDIREILLQCLTIESDYQTNRTLKSLEREWISHNRLYKLGLFKSHTKDSDFEAEQTLFYKICYFILGSL